MMRYMHWVLISDGKFKDFDDMIKTVFNVDKNEFGHIQNILKAQHEDITDLIKKVLASDLNDRQKNLAIYIIGTTIGVNYYSD